MGVIDEWRVGTVFACRRLLLVIHGFFVGTAGVIGTSGVNSRVSAIDGIVDVVLVSRIFAPDRVRVLLTSRDMGTDEARCGMRLVSNFRLFGDFFFVMQVVQKNNIWSVGNCVAAVYNVGFISVH